ncbi:MAG: hypothetical protein K2X66_02830, partial [Cyanobacteria bacterium]|nr:hypothetical protein [Cyanobacteriota bacterium]
MLGNLNPLKNPSDIAERVHPQFSKQLFLKRATAPVLNTSLLFGKQENPASSKKQPQKTPQKSFLSVLIEPFK